MTPRVFAAVTPCPSCGTVECHAIRPPNPAPTAAELDAWERNRETYEIHTFGAASPIVRHRPPRPVDESAFEVVRTCRCGAEWGEG